MATNRKPVKGILKQSSSFDKAGHHDVPPNKQAKWDEMNILATYHPEDKDYGHDKIDEPPTPYSAMEAEDDMDETTSEPPILDPNSLSDRLTSTVEAKVFAVPEEKESSEEDETETEEQRAKRKLFEQKRKLHYNEFQAVRLARQLLEEEDEDEDEEKDGASSEAKDNSCT